MLKKPSVVVSASSTPVAPVGPTAPCGPWGPVGPIGPCAPAGPAGPAGPMGPAGPPLGRSTHVHVDPVHAGTCAAAHVRSLSVILLSTTETSLAIVNVPVDVWCAKARS